MATPEIIAARIQNRRGKRQDLPQPLLPGEIGLCTDTREVFIGADPSDSSGISSPILYVYSEYVGSLTDYVADFTKTYLTTANEIINEHIVQIDLGVGDEYPNISEDLDVSSSPSVMVRVEIEDENNPGTILHERAYIAYKDSQPTLPSYPEIVSGNVQFLGNVKQFTGREYNLSGIVESGFEYSTLDTSAITQLINWVFDYSSAYVGNAVGSGTGLVTMSQNIEFITDWSNDYDNESVVLQRDIENNASSTPTGLWFSVEDSDSFTLNYSISNDDYLRKGEISMSVKLDEAILTDEFHELAPNLSTLPDVVFTANIVPGTSNKVVEVSYTANNLPVADVTKLSTNVVRWNSF